MYKFFLLAVLLFLACGLVAQDSTGLESPLVLHTATGDIQGTLLLPAGAGKVPVALIIAGSGPTDRNGNNPTMKNDHLRRLAYGLAAGGVASLRFDKRGVGESRKALTREADLRFDDYVVDAAAWIALLKKEARFSKVVVVGHSEGSLIGMIAAREGAAAFVSVAGPGRSADKVLKEQLAAQPPQLRDMAFPVIDSLAAGKPVEGVSPLLNSLFRASVQPYLVSWFRYDPQAEIRKLKVPVLVAQGSNDIQVPVEDAQLLQKADPGAQLLIVQHMNHILRLVEGDRAANISTYSNATLPVSSELVSSMVSFILKK